MNNQNRGSLVDYKEINPVRKVEIIENYRDKKKIYFIRAFANTYFGYMDDQFFGYSVPEDEKNTHWLMDAKQAIDYYIDKIPFHISVLEYDMFIRKDEYKPFINALKMVKDNNG